jgi:vacuolar-type H+-ATPase subunit H
MPQARKSARTSSRNNTFKEPAALKRLTQSLDNAQKALGDLRSHAGRTSAQTTRDLHKDVGKFVSSAKRDTGKFATSIKKDFEKAQKAMASGPASASRPASRARAGSASTRTAGRRTAAKRTTTRSTAAKRTTRKSS